MGLVLGARTEAERDDGERDDGNNLHDFVISLLSSPVGEGGGYWHWLKRDNEIPAAVSIGRQTTANEPSGPDGRPGS